MLMTQPVNNQFRVGLMFAIGSAVSFGMSGPFAKALMTAGWSPTAAVTARLLGGAIAMALFASVVRPGWFDPSSPGSSWDHRAHARGNAR